MCTWSKSKDITFTYFTNYEDKFSLSRGSSLCIEFQTRRVNYFTVENNVWPDWLFIHYIFKTFTTSRNMHNFNRNWNSFGELIDATNGKKRRRKLLGRNLQSRSLKRAWNLKNQSISTCSSKKVKIFELLILFNLLSRRVFEHYKEPWKFV